MAGIQNEADLLRADHYSWMLKRYSLPSKVPYTFDNHEFLVDLAKRKWIPGDNVFIRKSSQCGASEYLLGVLFWMNDRNLKSWKGSGLVFPATQQLQDHLKARVFPVMEMPYFASKLKNANLRFLRWNDKPIYFRGGQTRRDLISWPADFVALDEFDEFDDPISIIPTMEARLNASIYKWILGISTPTYPDIGIDRAYSMSNQHNWYVQCERCQKAFSPLVEIQARGFENCVVIAPLTKLVGFQCPHCHDLTQTNGTKGQWVLDRAVDNQRYAYSISRLFVKNGNLKTLLDKFYDALNIQEFYNSDLGLPYAPANAKLQMGDINNAAIGVSEIPFGSDEPTWMGVDVGLKCHWVVGRPIESGHKEVIAYGVCSFDELKDVELRYNVRHEVIDLRPYETEVKKHVNGRRGFFACDFNTGNQEDWYTFKLADDEVKGSSVRVIKADRTQSCDHLINQMAVKKSLIIPRQCKDDARFRNQMTAPTRMDLTDNKTGDIRAVYNSAGRADHFFFAFVYLLLAMELRRTNVASLGPRIYG